MISGCVGAGTLTLSKGIAVTGTIPSLFYLIFSCLTTLFTAYILILCTEFFLNLKINFFFN